MTWQNVEDVVDEGVHDGHGNVVGQKAVEEGVHDGHGLGRDPADDADVGVEPEDGNGVQLKELRTWLWTGILANGHGFEKFESSVARSTVQRREETPKVQLEEGGPTRGAA